MKLLQKDKLYRKPIHILSSQKIIRPITKFDYINVDIPCLTTSSCEWILACKKREHMVFIKDQLDHPYFISKTTLADLSYYMQKRPSNIVLVLDIYCDIATKSVIYLIAFINTCKLEFKIDKITF
jgi:hypothetical protein